MRGFQGYLFMCILVLLAGCASINDMAKPQVCVANAEGAYTGEPKPAAVAVVATVLQTAANKLGYPVDSGMATMAATAVLRGYCDGTYESVAVGIYETLQGFMGRKAAMEVTAKCLKP